MARAYQEAHILDNLTSSVKTLQSQTTDLSKAKALHEERITNLQKQNEQQANQISALETRSSANEHNTTARVQNAYLYHQHALHSPLTPLHALSTDRPIGHFPKHERDVRTMGVGEVIQVLQALDVKTLGMSAAEKKAELRVQVGLPRDVEGKGAVDGGGKGVVEGKGTADGRDEGKEKAVTEKKKPALPKVAPGSTAEKKGKVGGGVAEGVSKPGAGAAPKTPAAKAAAALGAEKKA